MDLKKVDPAKIAEEGYEFNVLLVDGTETDAFITVRGVHSKIVTKHTRDTFKQQEARAKAAKRRGKEDELSVEELEEMLIKSAVVRTIDWRGIQEDGEDVPFTVENATRIYKDYPFIREQVMDESNNVSNFRSDGD